MTTAATPVGWNSWTVLALSSSHGPSDQHSVYVADEPSEMFSRKEVWSCEFKMPP